MLERSFYMRLRTINDRSFNVDDSNLLPSDTKQPVVKLNGQEIGQCFVKRVDDTRLILTVAPSFEEDEFDSLDNSSEDSSIQPINRSRANTWHHNKRTVGQVSSSQSSLNQDEFPHYYRTMSVGSKPRLNTDVSSWTQLRLDHSSCTSVNANASQSEPKVPDVKVDHQSSFPKTMYIEFYDCRQEDIENVLMSDNHSFDHTIIDDYTDDSNYSSNSTSSRCSSSSSISISSSSSSSSGSSSNSSDDENKDEDKDSSEEIDSDEPGTTKS